MKLLAIDMDGTLLHDGNYVTQKQVDYLLNLIYRKEVKIVITTGRPLAGIKNLLPKEFYENVFRIALNGSLIQTPEDEILQISSLEHDEVLEILEYADSHETDVSILDEHKFYSLSKNITDLMSYDASLNKMIMEYYDITHINHLEYITKLLIFSEPDKISCLRSKLPEKFYKQFSIIFSQDYLIEFLPKKIDKGSSLLKLADELEIPHRSIISIGDGLNDRTMLEVAKVAIAMDNAHPDIKEMADIISLTNNDDGVIHALKRIGL